MADKELRIKVTTEADTSDMERLEDVVGNVVDRADEAGSALQTAFQEATDRVSELESALDSAVLEGDTEGAEQIAQELSEARDEAEQLEQELANIDGGSLDNASESAKQLTSELEGATGASGELSSSMGLIEGTMMLDLANQTGEIGGTAENIAQGIDTASISVGQLATQTQIAEPQMRSLISYISNATFPQEEAMAYVEALHQMGVNANNFGESATDMDRINDAFGIGYQNVVQLTRAMQVVGVDANNLDTSFNALYYAQTHVNGGVNTLTTALGRNGASFAEYGLNIDQVALIMETASHKWTTARQLNSGLSQALKQSGGDVRALEQALGMEAGALDRASEATGQYDGQLQNLANEEAEHKTITQQLGALLEDLSLQLSPVLSPLMSFVGLIGQFGQTALSINSIITLAETFGILKRTEEGLIPIQFAEGVAGNFSISWIVIAIALGIALGLALVYLYNHSERFRNAVNWLGQKLMWLANTIVGSVQGAINWFRNAIQAIPKAIQDCLNWASSLIMNHPIVQAIKWLGDNLAYIFSAIGLGQRSPGKIYKAMKLELDSSEELIQDSELPEMMGTLGGRMSYKFNPGLNKMDSSNLGNNLINETINNNEEGGKSVIYNVFNIDYLAKKEFVQEIADIIKNEISWDNKTAGRTN